MRDRFALALGLVVACAPRASAPEAIRVTDRVTPDPDVRDLSAELEPIRVSGKLPALAAAAFRGDALLAIGAVGFQREGSDARVTRDARWHIGSDTKAMTAVLVAMQIDRGALHFEDTLASLFPDLAIDAALKPVTVEQLLEHRGGLAAALPKEVLVQMWSEAEDPASRAHAVAAILATPPARAVGTFEYSNSSYVVLGAILERITKKTWEDLIREDLFAKLGMTHCGFGAPSEPDAPWGHRRDGERLVPVSPEAIASDNPPALGPAGRVHCTLADWGKFLAVILAGARGDVARSQGNPIASSATMKRLLTPPAGASANERYAGGWSFTERGWGGGTVLTHSGSNTMWLATAWLAPEKNLAFVAATNVFAPKELDAAFGAMVNAYAKEPAK